MGNPIVQTENLGAFEHIKPSQVHRVAVSPRIRLSKGQLEGMVLRFSLVVPANQEGLVFGLTLWPDRSNSGKRLRLLFSRRRSR